MAADDSTNTLDLFDRCIGGDEFARRLLITRLYDRLLALSRVILGRFPKLERELSPESVFHEAWIDLETALRKAQPASIGAFFGLAAKKIRERLLDILEKNRVPMIRDGDRPHRDDESASSSPRVDAAVSSLSPLQLAIWTEFHSKVNELPDDERAIFDMHYYDGLTQAEIAGILRIPPKQVSRLWISATERLADFVPDSSELLLL